MTALNSLGYVFNNTACLDLNSYSFSNTYNNSILFHKNKIMLSDQNMNPKQICIFSERVLHCNSEHSKQTKTSLRPGSVHEDQSDWDTKQWLDDS